MTAATAGELVVFDGGPWNGWWLTRARLEDNQNAARHLRNDASSPPGVSLGYAATEDWRPNPEVKGEGRVWRWQPLSAAAPNRDLPPLTAATPSAPTRGRTP